MNIPFLSTHFFVHPSRHFAVLTFTLASALALLSGNVYAQDLAKTPALKCELRDDTLNRIVEQKSSRFEAGKNILFLMGSYELSGSVRDLPGDHDNERKLDLELSYQYGSSWGHSNAKTTYLTTQTPGELSSVSIIEPNWSHEISLHCSLTEL